MLVNLIDEFIMSEFGTRFDLLTLAEPIVDLVARPQLFFAGRAVLVGILFGEQKFFRKRILSNRELQFRLSRPPLALFGPVSIQPVAFVFAFFIIT